MYAWHPVHSRRYLRTFTKKEFMQRDENRVLREELGRVADEMSGLADKGKLTDAERSQFGRLEARAKEVRARLKLIESAESIYTETRRTGAPPNGQVGDVVAPTEQYDQDYRTAFNRYLKRGRNEISVEDRAILKIDKRDMGEGTPTGGAYPGSTTGFFVPVGFNRRIEQALKYYGPMLQNDVVTILDTDTGAPLPFPTSNDTGTLCELIGEGQQVSTADVSIGQIMFGSYKFSSKLVKVSLELLEDSAFNLEDFLVEQFSLRFGRGLNVFFTTGTGTNQPTGIVTAALAGGVITTAVGANTNDGASGPNTIGSDDLTNLEHSVDPLYRPGAMYMMADKTLQAIKKVKDKYGRPLWVQSVRDGEPDTINGYSYRINNDMDALQTQASSPTLTNTTMLFGATKKFTVRRVRNMSVLRLSERFADYGQVAFLGFMRVDSQLLDAGTHPVAALQNIY
jgi:HK97 family phage major capsid protein